MKTEFQSADNDIEIRVTLKNSEGTVLDASLGKIGWQAKDMSGRVLEGCTGSEPQNCYINDTTLIIAAPSNTFLNGSISVRIKLILENENFPDSTKDIWGEWIKTNLMIK